MRRWRDLGLSVLIAVSVSIRSDASLDTIGTNGINSSGLMGLDGMPLTGAGIGIGQIEIGRPGRRVADGGPDDAAHSDISIVPVGLFRGNTADTVPNTLTDEHAQWVAGVMISTDATRRGVAPGAQLYAAARNPSTDVQEGHSQSGQHIATRNGGDVRAINLSFGITLDGAELDGNDLLTQFIDWSAAHHDVLYVVAGSEPPIGFPVPSENYNGITVAASSKVGSVYRQVAAFNDFSEQPPGERTVISLIAPGNDVDMVGFAGASAPALDDSGTSFAAPHVTATVALLQQYAEQNIAAPMPRWDVDARRHQVMKAVLMNSADKFIDNGTVTAPGEVDPLPPGSLIGMERTVIDQNGDDWFDSEAYGDEPFFGPDTLPLDDQMGAGHLNAKRALQQFQSGEYDSGPADVPLIGWDYGTTSGEFDTNRYSIGPQLLGGSFISVTMAWDRVVEFAVDGGTENVYDIGDEFEPWTDDVPPADDQINDLDLYLVPSGMSTASAIAQSFSNDSTIEHLFFQIPATGSYDLIVEQFDDEAGFGGQPYAIAWWAAGVPSIVPGDYDGNGTIGPEDYDIWRQNFGEPIAAGTGADGNGDGVIDAADYIVWRKNRTGGSGSLANVPEPNSLTLFAFCVVLLCGRRKKLRRMGSPQSGNPSIRRHA